MHNTIGVEDAAGSTIIEPHSTSKAVLDNRLLLVFIPEIYIAISSPLRPSRIRLRPGFLKSVF